MHFRLLVVMLAAASALSAYEAGAQDQRASRDRYADGLISGDYVRLSGGSLTPVNPQGSLRDWGAGSGFSLMWENWGSGAAGVGVVGFGIGVNYGRLALDEERFVSQFRDPLTQAPATSVESAHASVLEIETTLRVRIPSPFIMPSFSIGFGYINYKPGSIHYNTALGPASTAQQTRYGGEFTIGAGLDKNIYDR